MTKLFFPIAAFGLLIFTSCGSNKVKENMNAYYDSILKADSLAEFGPATDMNFTQAQDTANDGKRVSIIGYLDVPDNSYSSASTGQLKFIERPNEMDGVNFILSVKLGPGKNTMKALEDKYTTADVTVTGNKNEAIKAGDRVKITGKLGSSGSYCSLDVQEIEKLEEVAIDYSTLNATKISDKQPDASMDGKLVYAEGTIEMPVITMGGEYTFVYLHVPGIEEQLTVDVAYGTGPGKLEPLPDNYSDKDIKIQDTKGNAINLKKKVRVYGVWSGERLKAEAIDNI